MSTDSQGGDGPAPWVGSMTFKVTQVNAVMGGAVLVGFNSNRYYFSVSSSNISMPFNIQPGLLIATGQGIQMTSSVQFLEFYFSRHGVIVQQDWSYYAPGAGFNITVIEGLWLPKGG